MGGRSKLENGKYVELEERGGSATRAESEGKGASADAEGGIFNVLTFSHLNPLLSTGFSRPVVFEDMPALLATDRAELVGDELQALWDAEVKACAAEKQEPSLLRVLIRAHGREYAMGNLLKVPQDVLLFAGPFLLERLIRFVDPQLTADTELRFQDGFVLVLGMFAAQLIQSLCLHQYFNKVFHVAMQARTGLMCMVYSKALGLSHSARRDEDSSTGSVVNMMQVDVQKFLDFIPYSANLLWSSPFQVLVCVALLWRYVGVACLAGLFTILAILPINMWAMKELEKVQSSNMQFKDQRVRAVSELLSGIRVLKLFSWEQPAIKNVMHVRNKEMRALRRFGILGALQGVLWSSTTAFVALATFGTYTSLGNRLSLDVALPVLSLITILQFPLLVLPWMFISSISFRIALRRIQKFLLQPSIVDRRKKLPPPSPDDEVCGDTVTFDEVSLEWEPGTSVLEAVSLQVPQGSLVAVVGPVGSGKTTLLSALLGELEMTQGRVGVCSDPCIGYVPQEPWVVHASLKENVIMGAPLDEQRYQRAIEVSCLQADLKALPSGDATEIGERGINLSGGQKQRVCLARAVYSQAGLFVLDDPLSAVDSHVAQHIFTECIAGEMAGCTRVLVTHRVDLVRHVQHIVVLGEKSIVAQGTYAELLAKGVDMGIHEDEGAGEDEADSALLDSGGEKEGGSEPHMKAAYDPDELAVSPPAVPHAERVPSAIPGHKAGEKGDAGVANDEDQGVKAVSGHALIQDEERETGLVKKDTVEAYLQSVGRQMLIIVVALGAGSQTARVLIGWWISTWAADDSFISPEGIQRRASALEPSSQALHIMAGWGILVSSRPLAQLPLLRRLGNYSGESTVHATGVGGVGRKGRRDDGVGDDEDGSDSGAPPPDPPPRPPARPFTAKPPPAPLQPPHAPSAPPAPPRDQTTGQHYEEEDGEEEGPGAGEAGGRDNGVEHGSYLWIYTFLILVEAVTTFGRDAALAIGSLRASTRLHNRMLDSIMSCPMLFFDSTPLGRVLNRFSKDQDTADGSLPQSLNELYSCALSTLGPVVLMISVTPISLLGVLPTLHVYFSIFQYFRRTSREIKRLEATYRSPIYAHFTESLHGVACLRAFKLVRRFEDASHERIDALNRVFWPMISCNRWLGLRLELCGNALISSAALAAVLARWMGNVDHHYAALLGLSVTYALGITNELGWMVRQSTEAEANMNSIERIESYAKLESEAASQTPGDAAVAGSSWPSRGEIVFKEVFLRYRPSTPYVLKGLSLTVPAGEKVGIVGRTGAGKSSLLVSLFRLVEVDSGTIMIDGVDIRGLGLNTLRSRLAIVPQDPVLFTGTVRYNMDPFDQYTDAQIWSALATVSMRGKISSLDSKVTENGSNMSLGERQLMCMGRAILRNAKILVLDEATAAIDMATDEVIQQALRDKCHGRTILTIAHRLNTILDYDKVCVLGEGTVLEYDSPQSLVANVSSHFASMFTRELDFGV